MYDYYSIGYSTQIDAQAAISAIGPVAAVAGPFLFGATIAQDGNGLLQSTGGQWFFNIRSEAPLAGAWIGPMPGTPNNVWLGGAVASPPPASAPMVPSDDGSTFYALTADNTTGKLKTTEVM